MSQIENLDRRQRPGADPLWQPQQVHSVPYPGEALSRRRRTAEDQAGPLQPGADQRDVAGVVAGRLAVLVARLVFLVQHDDAERGHGREDRRPGSDRHPLLASVQRAPGVGPLPLGQCAVQHRHLVAEGPAHPAHRLRSQADLGHQQDGPLPLAERPADGLEVDQRLAAPGNTEEQCTLSRPQRRNPADGLLLRGSDPIRRRCSRLFGERITQPLRVLDPGHSLGHQPADHRLAEAQLASQVAHRRAAAQFLERLEQAALLPGPAKELLTLEQRGRVPEDKDPFAGRGAVGFRRLDLEGDCAHPHQPVHRLPGRSLEGAPDGAHRAAPPFRSSQSSTSPPKPPAPPGAPGTRVAMTRDSPQSAEGSIAFSVRPMGEA